MCRRDLGKDSAPSYSNLLNCKNQEKTNTRSAIALQALTTVNQQPNHSNN